MLKTLGKTRGRGGKTAEAMVLGTVEVDDKQLEQPADAGRRQCLATLAACALTPGAAQAAWPFGGNSDGKRRFVVAAYPAIDKVIKAALPEFAKLHPDVEVQIVSRQFADHHTAMTTALTTASNLPDLMTLAVDYLGNFARGIGLEDLRPAPYNILQYKDRFVPFAFDQATARDGSVLAVPADIGPGTLLYRADLMAKAGISEADLTRSFDSYVEAGVRLRKATGAYLVPNARDVKDMVVRIGILPGQSTYFDKDGKAMIDTPRFRRAFELSQRVRQNQLDAKVRPWSSDWGEGFKRGAIATQMMGAWMAGHLNNWLAPNTRGLWRTAQLPEGAFAASGGTFYAIPRRGKAEQKPIAWDLIRLMTMKREQQLEAFKTQDAFPALLETFDDPFFEQPIEFLGGQAGRVVWREATRHIQAVQVHKQDGFATEVVNTELDKVMNENKSIDVALADAQRLVQARAFR